MNDQTNEPTPARDIAQETPTGEPVLRLGTLTIFGDRSKLFGALAKAQAKFAPIKRTRTVKVRSEKGNYDFDYAPLEEVIAATLPALNSEGLAWTSMTADREGSEDVDLHTLLTHESGAFVHVCEILPPVHKAQERGSQLTYKRRYQYQCLTGSSPEVDDDGNAADGNKVEAMADRKRREPPPVQPKPAPKPEPKPEAKAPEVKPEPPKSEPPVAPTITPDDGPMTQEQSDQIKNHFASLGLRGPANAQRALDFCLKVVGKTGKDFTEGDADKMLSVLRDEAKAQAILAEISKGAG